MSPPRSPRFFISYMGSFVDDVAQNQAIVEERLSTGGSAGTGPGSVQRVEMMVLAPDVDHTAGDARG